VVVMVMVVARMVLTAANGSKATTVRMTSSTAVVTQLGKGVTR
jgi:hypothetical protein